MKIEKLRKEIGQIVTESISGLLAPSTDEEYSRVEQKIAQRLIARIGEAVLSGECADLDKLLGVVGRLEQEPRTTFYSRGVERSLQGWIRNRFKQGARTFIAVRRAK